MDPVDQSTSTVVAAPESEDEPNIPRPPQPPPTNPFATLTPDLQSRLDSLPDSPQIPARSLPAHKALNNLLDTNETTLFDEHTTTNSSSCMYPALTEPHSWPSTPVCCAHPPRSRSPRVIDPASIPATRLRHNERSETGTGDEAIPMVELSRKSQ